LPEHEELAARLAPLVRHFIVHPGLPEDAPALGALINAWAKKYPRSRPEHRRFLAENTLPGRIEALLPHLDEDTGICMDTGHLLLEGKNPSDFLRKYGDRVGEIHLHGLNREKAALDGRLPDHRPIQAAAPWLRELLPQLKAFNGIVNTEVFSWEEAESSINALTEILKEKEI
jgi:sugar phosphate isomerase/epimerase